MRVLAKTASDTQEGHDDILQSGFRDRNADSAMRPRKRTVPSPPRQRSSRRQATVYRRSKHGGGTRSLEDVWRHLRSPAMYLDAPLPRKVRLANESCVRPKP
ncbi:unnamed protein product [Ixodes persulcatus]